MKALEFNQVFEELKNRERQTMNNWDVWPCTIRGCKATFAKLYVHPDAEYPEPYCEDHALALALDEFPGIVE